MYFKIYPLYFYTGVTRKPFEKGKKEYHPVYMYKPSQVVFEET